MSGDIQVSHKFLITIDLHCSDGKVSQVSDEIYHYGKGTINPQQIRASIPFSILMSPRGLDEHGRVKDIDILQSYGTQIGPPSYGKHVADPLLSGLTPESPCYSADGEFEGSIGRSGDDLYGHR